MPRFFIKKENMENGTAFIFGEDAFHIARSLRMAVGDTVTLSDGEGFDYEAKLSFIRDSECRCEIISSETGVTEAPVDIAIYMAYPKGDKLELVIQKAVELGASRIVPFESERCIKKPKAEKAEKQLMRLSRIAEEAAKQCGRSRLPEVSPTKSFSEMLNEASAADLALFCYEGDGTEPIKTHLVRFKEALFAEPKTENRKTVSAVIGCEGGFSDAEASAAYAAGLLPTGLGKRILRCETAPMYVLSAISYELEL